MNLGGVPLGPSQRHASIVIVLLAGCLGASSQTQQTALAKELALIEAPRTSIYSACSAIYDLESLDSYEQDVAKLRRDETLVVARRCIELDKGWRLLSVLAEADPNLAGEAATALSQGCETQRADPDHVERCVAAEQNRRRATGEQPLSVAEQAELYDAACKNAASSGSLACNMAVSLLSQSDPDEGWARIEARCKVMFEHHCVELAKREASGAWKPRDGHSALRMVESMCDRHDDEACEKASWIYVDTARAQEFRSKSDAALRRNCVANSRRACEKGAKRATGADVVWWAERSCKLGVHDHCELFLALAVPSPELSLAACEAGAEFMCVHLAWSRLGTQGTLEKLCKERTMACVCHESKRVQMGGRPDPGVAVKLYETLASQCPLDRRCPLLPNFDDVRHAVMSRPKTAAERELDKCQRHEDAYQRQQREGNGGLVVRCANHQELASQAGSARYEAERLMKAATLPALCPPPKSPSKK
jgi:hypothetical protein